MAHILLAVCLWYALGAVAAWWATHKGHAPDLWFIGAALWGAIMVPLVVAARLAVLVRPARPQLPVRSPTTTGLHALLLVHVDDSPKQALAPLVGMALELHALDIVVLVSEEASSRLIASPEMAKAEQSLHRILRAIPPVETSAAITSLSGLDHLARSGWQADLVIATPTVSHHRLSRSVARSVSRMGNLPRERRGQHVPRLAASRRRSTKPPIHAERVDAA